MIAEHFARQARDAGGRRELVFSHWNSPVSDAAERFDAGGAV